MTRGSREAYYARGATPPPGVLTGRLCGRGILYGFSGFTVTNRNSYFRRVPVVL